MWVLDNRTPYQAERTWVRDQDGMHHWIVVVKATYDIAEDGKKTLAEAPIAPLYTPQYQGVPGESSIRYDADLVAMKPATDLYFNAIAFAPRGQPCTEVRVSIRVNRLRKELLIQGERLWERGPGGRVKRSSPKPFETMPICYERAFGGLDRDESDPRKHRIDFRNPVGSGMAYHKRRLWGALAPSIEHPGHKLGDGWPAGFGAIASYWSPRKELAGTYDDQWKATRQPLLPADYDSRYLLCAPQDQQYPTYLKGGELLELVNLTPTGHLRLELPKVSLTFSTFFGSIEKQHQAALVSVIVDSEGPRLILVWQTSLICGNDADYLDRTVIEATEWKR